MTPRKPGTKDRLITGISSATDERIQQIAEAHFLPVAVVVRGVLDLIASGDLPVVVEYAAPEAEGQPHQSSVQLNALAASGGGPAAYVIKVPKGAMTRTPNRRLGTVITIPAIPAVVREATAQSRAVEREEGRRRAAALMASAQPKRQPTLDELHRRVHPDSNRSTSEPGRTPAPERGTSRGGAGELVGRTPSSTDKRKGR